jgi:dihydroneopterin aldolase
MYRMVNLFAQRLQLQERLTNQIGQALQQVTRARGVHVEVDGQHLCVAMRGVQRTDSWMHTQFKAGVAIPHASLSTNHTPAYHPSEFFLSNICDPSNCNHPQPTVHRLKLQTPEIPLHIGCFPEEQQKTTPIRLEIELQLPETYGTTADDLSQTVCYDQLMRRIQNDCLQEKFQLIEYAGASIYRCIHRFLDEQNRMARVKVTLTKLLSHPLISNSQYTIGDF